MNPSAGDSVARRDGRPRDDARWSHGGEVGRYVDELLARASRLDTFAGARFDGPDQLKLFGVADPPDDVWALLRDPPAGFSVSWTEAAYSARELAQEARLVALSPRVTSAGGDVDGSGLVVGTLDQELLDAADPGRLLGTSIPVRTEARGPATLTASEAG